MIAFDHAKCLRCGVCLRDCMGGILTKDEAGYPVLTPAREKYCIACGHCYAVCPAGAVTFHGRTAEQASASGPLPDSALVANLLRQRRSCRHYKTEPVSREKLDRLKEILNYSPTGCNDHRLIFSLVEDPAVMDMIRGRVLKRLKTMMKLGVIQLLFPPSRRYFADIMNGADMIFRGAPHLIAVSTPVFAPCSTWDAKIALSYFDTYAQSMGLGTCWCGFGVWAFRMMPGLRRMLKLPWFYRLDAMMIFGEPDIRYARPVTPDPFRVDVIGSSGQN